MHVETQKTLRDFKMMGKGLKAMSSSKVVLSESRDGEIDREIGELAFEFVKSPSAFQGREFVMDELISERAARLSGRIFPRTQGRRSERVIVERGADGRLRLCKRRLEKAE